MIIDVITKEACAYCTWAKNLLEKKGLSYNEKKLGTLNENGETITREFIINKFPNARQFPIILVDGYDVGGYEGLQTYLNTIEPAYPAYHNMQLLVD